VLKSLKICACLYIFIILKEFKKTILCLLNNKNVTGSKLTKGYKVQCCRGAGTGTDVF
jgi:hypothetical protein